MPPAREIGRRELFGGAGVVLAVFGVVLGKRAARAISVATRGATREQCETLLDHWINHASRQQDPLVQDDDIERAEQVARGKPEYLVDLQRCEDELTSAEVACGIGAPNADAFERCVQ